MTIEIPPIISVDDHVVEPADLWERWLPAKHRDAGPHVVKSAWEPIPVGRQAFRMAPNAPGPEKDFWVFGKFSGAFDIGSAAAGLGRDAIELGPIDYEEMRPGYFTVPDRLADMSQNHVERSLCFPSFPRFCGQIFLQSVTWGEDRDVALACVRAYNDWMVDEWCGESGGRLIPLQIVPLWDPQGCADEVRRNAARGVRAVTFSERPQFLDLPTVYDKDGYWEPFIRACAETGTVICMHIGSSSSSPKSADDSNVGANITLTSVASMYCLTDWAMSGTMARHPELKIALSESQVGWMPYHIQRMDTVWRTGRASPVLKIPPELTEPPSHYLEGRLFACIVDDEFGTAVRGGPLGVGQLTFESDYPHMDSTWPNTKAAAERALAGYSQHEVDQVCRGNAITLFDLPASLPA